MQRITIEAFIFDLDGVITDTAEYHFRSWKRLADEEGIPFTREDNEALRGVSRRESLNLMLKGRPIEEDTAQAWMMRKNDYYNEYLEEVSPTDLLPGVDQFLHEAARMGIKIAVASASRNARTVLERLQIIDRFDAIGDGYSVVNTKPAPDLFVWTAGRLGVNPRNAVVVEDAEAGVEAALSGGFYVVGVGTANVAKAHIMLPGLGDTSPTALIERLNALAENRTTPA